MSLARQCWVRISGRGAGLRRRSWSHCCALALAGHLWRRPWALFWLGAAARAAFGSAGTWLVGSLLALVFIVWLLNLYNFMDGIDGIASIEAICVRRCVALLCRGRAVGKALGYVEWLLIAAVVGFACWNFPRARIFMGMPGLLASPSASWHCVAAASRQLLWSWLILLGVFIVDATLLLRRLLRAKLLSGSSQPCVSGCGAALWPPCAGDGCGWTDQPGWLLPWAVGWPGRSRRCGGHADRLFAVVVPLPLAWRRCA